MSRKTAQGCRLPFAAEVTSGSVGNGDIVTATSSLAHGKTFDEIERTFSKADPNIKLMTAKVPG